MSRKSLYAVIIVAVLAVGGFLALNNAGTSTSGNDVAAIVPAAGADATAVIEDTAATHTEATAEIAPAGHATLDLDRMLAARTLGNPDAPVKVEEFASLTCSHCATFYADTFPAFKEQYIDTGKVFFTYTDFPLNAPALDAAMVTRCLPDQHYFPFLKMLFENQSQWAYNDKYREILQHNAAMLGMSSEYFDNCLAHDGLRQGLIKAMQEKSATHQVRSTPSFVINGERLIQGAVPLDVLRGAIDPLLNANQE